MSLEEQLAEALRRIVSLEEHVAELREAQSNAPRESDIERAIESHEMQFHRD